MSSFLNWLWHWVKKIKWNKLKYNRSCIIIFQRLHLAIIKENWLIVFISNFLYAKPNYSKTLNGEYEPYAWQILSIKTINIVKNGKSQKSWSTINRKKKKKKNGNTINIMKICKVGFSQFAGSNE